MSDGLADVEDQEDCVSKGSVLWNEFRVRHEFPVYFTRDAFTVANVTLRDALTRLEPNKRHRVIAFVDSGLEAVDETINDRITAYAQAHSKHIDLVSAPIQVTGGEAIKWDPAAIDRLQQTLVDHHIDRHSYVLAIGGGAVLDAVGFVAATTHRGVRLVRMPTTVLAQNDAGIGVKNGVNRFGQKNLNGAFAPPFAVVNDGFFIDVLPDRDKIAGMAEALKVALIRDPQFYRWLEDNRPALARFQTTEMGWMIRRCAELHLQQITNGGDPFESGSARPLDYGHWSAHKLETMTNHELRHGEAVAIGIALDARYSVLMGLLRPGLEERICRLLRGLGFRLWHPALDELDEHGKHILLGGLEDFREHLGGELTITLLSDLGTGIEVGEMNEPAVLDAIGWLKAGNSCRWS